MQNKKNKWRKWVVKTVKIGIPCILAALTLTGCEFKPIVPQPPRPIPIEKVLPEEKYLFLDMPSFEIQDFQLTKCQHGCDINSTTHSCFQQISYKMPDVPYEMTFEHSEPIQKVFSQEEVDKFEYLIKELETCQTEKYILDLKTIGINAYDGLDFLNDFTDYCAGGVSTDLAPIASSVHYDGNGENPHVEISVERAVEKIEYYKDEPLRQAVIRDAIEQIVDNLNLTGYMKHDLAQIHDYLCLYAQYNNDIDKYEYYHEWENYSTYDVFANGYGICESYSLAYKLICDYVGLPIYYDDGLTFEGVGHVWNYVEIEGNVFYIDVTYDDMDAAGGVEFTYDYFLQNIGSDGLQNDGPTYKT